MRMSEVLGLRWDAVDLTTADVDGRPKGEIRLKAAEIKTRQGRTVSLGITPALRTLLAAMKLRAGDARYVFGGKAPMSKADAEAARRRLIGAIPKKERQGKGKRKRHVQVITDFGAPKNFTWQLLRSTCAGGCSRY
jgi:hypothetical protein